MPKRNHKVEKYTSGVQQLCRWSKITDLWTIRQGNGTHTEKQDKKIIL